MTGNKNIDLCGCGSFNDSVDAAMRMFNQMTSTDDCPAWHINVARHLTAICTAHYEMWVYAHLKETYGDALDNVTAAGMTRENGVSTFARFDKMLEESDTFEKFEKLMTEKWGDTFADMTAAMEAYNNKKPANIEEMLKSMFGPNVTVHKTSLNDVLRAGLDDINDPATPPAGDGSKTH